MCTLPTSQCIEEITMMGPNRAEIGRNNWSWTKKLLIDFWALRRGHRYTEWGTEKTRKLGLANHAQKHEDLCYLIYQIRWRALLWQGVKLHLFFCNFFPFRLYTRVVHPAKKNKCAARMQNQITENLIGFLQKIVRADWNWCLSRVRAQSLPPARA